MKKNSLIFALSCIDSRSSGYIMRSALELANKNGFDYVVATPEDSRKKNSIFISQSMNNKIERLFDRAYNKIFKPVEGFKSPFLSIKVSKLLSSYCKRYNNVIVHIHALHDVPFSMVPILKYIHRKQLPCVYTFHDVWPFTGGCYNFEQYCCDGYKAKCKNCAFGYENSNKYFKKKIKLLDRLDNLVIVPVSQYCKDRVNETLLKKKRIELINVETNVKLKQTNEELKKQLGISEEDRVIVSVCAYWCSLKGVEYLYKIADRLPDGYKLLVIGGGFKKEGYENIVHVPFVDRINELPSYFSFSDVFASVTQGDNFPLVLIEAQCCGVPIVGFGHGGTPEEITPLSGIMVGKDNNVDKLVEKLIFVCENHPFKKNDIIKSGKRFSSGNNNIKYLNLYINLINRDK